MSNYKNLSDAEKHNSDWMNTKWRPMMGWMYMTVCLFDFMLAPILWSVLQALGNHGHVETQWQPLTLQGAGLFHVAMGAVLGIAAYGRTQEKLSGVAVGQGGGLSQGFGPGAGTTYVPPGQGSVSVVNSNQQPTNFGTNNNFSSHASAFAPSFGSPAPAFGSPAPAFGSSAPAFGSKPFGPPPVQQPPL
jgi:hypothetical protein